MKKKQTYSYFDKFSIIYLYPLGSALFFLFIFTQLLSYIISITLKSNLILTIGNIVIGYFAIQIYWYIQDKGFEHLNKNEN